jgi:hypothetical protein
MPYILPERRTFLDPIVDELGRIKLNPGEIPALIRELVEKAPGSHYPDRKFKQVGNLASAVEVKPDGDINYILFKYCVYYVKPSYNNYKAFMGGIYRSMGYHGFDFFYTNSDAIDDELRESAEWIRIKLLTPYEEKKILENGDV